MLTRKVINEKTKEIYNLIINDSEIIIGNETYKVIKRTNNRFDIYCMVDSKTIDTTIASFEVLNDDLIAYSLNDKTICKYTVVDPNEPQGPNFILFYNGVKNLILSSRTPLYKIKNETVTTNIGTYGNSCNSLSVQENSGKLQITEVKKRLDSIVYRSQYPNQSFEVVWDSEKNPLLVCVGGCCYPVVSFR